MPLPPGYVLLLVTDKPALGGLWFCGVDHFSQKEDALGIGGKDHKEELVKPKGLAIVPGAKRWQNCRRPLQPGCQLHHLQDGLAETLKGKWLVLAPRERVYVSRSAVSNTLRAHGL